MFNLNKQSMTVNQYFQVVHPKYLILRITPDTSIRNYNSSNIAKAIQYMYRDITRRIHRMEKKFIYETPMKCSFLIDIKKDDVSFYFIVPEKYKSLIKEKITETWPKATVTIITDIIPFSESSIKYQLKYSNEDALSLSADKKCNEPLNSILNVLDILEEDDRVGIFYNFIPGVQRGWKIEYKNTINKLKNNEPIEREKFTAKYILKEGLILALNLLQDLLDSVGDFFGNENKKEKPTLSELAIGSMMLDDRKKLSRATINKKDSIILNTQILVVSDGKAPGRLNNNAISVCESFNSLSDDNSLVYKRLPKKSVFNAVDFKIQGVEENKCCIEECQNFLELPGRDLLQQYKIIKKIDVLETQLPKELIMGIKRIGKNEFKGSKQMAYFTLDKDYKNLATVYIGPTRSGKTTALCNYAQDSINNGECIVVLDSIENCGLSNDIKAYIPKDKILEIDLSNFNNLQGLGYNELDFDTDDVLEQYDNAKLKTNQLEFLINSINDDDSDLKARMGRYLDAAALTVFICNGPIKDVFKILQDHKLRKTYIDSIPHIQKENFEEYISALEELNEFSKATKDNPVEIIGTKSSFVQGILNRVNRLKKNTVLELMLKKDTNDNINLVEELQKGKAIFIKMPENKFGTPEERDIITTYWLTKIWLALQIRASKITNRYDRTTVNIITDELNQLNAAQEFVGLKLDQCAKFGGKFVISTMYINQLKIREKLRTANTSYIIISGSDKTNFNELKEELQQFQFTLEDLFNLKRYNSLNLIKYEKGYCAFISQLPPPKSKTI